ncbi:MAG TPA: nucleotidyltransferase domain-containing protein [Candidatus Kapabacteria bacterium]|jgi:predicted nucleotidyltransferase|nr:nucleotidyltransferase domain-containing protein [Candidatus Kapabacteria bacterium]
MVTEEAIRNFAAEVARRYKPEKIILFGSYARGTANEDSDVDMLVIMDFEGRERQMVSEIRSKIRSHFPLDLLVRRAPDIQWRIKEDDFFLQEVMRQGTILYATPH